MRLCYAVLIFATFSHVTGQQVNIGRQCSLDSECPERAKCVNLTCNTKICICESPSWPTALFNECKLGVKLGQECGSNSVVCKDQSTMSMECKQNKCQCRERYEPSDDGTRCRERMLSSRSRRGFGLLGDFCSGSDLCFGPQAECDTVNAVCICKPGYRPKTDEEIHMYVGDPQECIDENWATGCVTAKVTPPTTTTMPTTTTTTQPPTPPPTTVVVPPTTVVVPPETPKQTASLIKQTPSEEKPTQPLHRTTIGSVAIPPSEGDVAAVVMTTPAPTAAPTTPPVDGTTPSTRPKPPRPIKRQVPESFENMDMGKFYGTWGPIFGGLAGLVIICGIISIVLAMRRRRKKSEGSKGTSVSSSSSVTGSTGSESEYSYRPRVKVKEISSAHHRMPSARKQSRLDQDFRQQTNRRR